MLCNHLPTAFTLHENPGVSFDERERRAVAFAPSRKSAGHDSRFAVYLDPNIIALTILESEVAGSDAFDFLIAVRDTPVETCEYEIFGENAFVSSHIASYDCSVKIFVDS